MDEAREYERSKYAYYGGLLTLLRPDIMIFTNARGEIRQGTWTIGGIPAGGFTVHPIAWLDEETRLREDEGKR